MKKTLLSVVLLVASAGTSFLDAAEKGHAHRAPHRDVIQEAEGVHAQFLIDKGGQPKLYLYDKSMKPLEKARARLE